MITFLFSEREEVLTVPIHIPSSSGKGLVVTMARYLFPLLTKGKGVVVVVLIMAIYPHSSFPKGKDWRSDPYTLLPLLGKGLVVIMARYLVPPLAKRDWW